MDVSSPHRLSLPQMERFASELEQAVESHIKWNTQIHRVLIFGEQFHPDELAEDAHRRCSFGRWYHREESAPLREFAEYRAICPIHEKAHHLAAALLRAKERGELTPAAYDEWIHCGEELRRLLHDLRGRLRQELGLASRLMAQVFDNAAEGVIITASDGTILTVNRAFTEVTGYAPEEVLGKKPSLLRSDRHDQKFYERMWQKLALDGEWQGEIWNRRKNGEIYLEWLSIVAVRNQMDETNYVAMFSDITADKQNEERLYRLAHYDPLTELPNRVLFQDRFQQALARARRGDRQIALMFLDLDGFKEVNDRFGHSAGDALLSQVAARLTEGLRKSDTVARLGGDEFCILLPDLYETLGLPSLAQKVIESFAEPFTVSGDRQVSITTSIGVSQYPDDGDDTDELLRRADLAMYAAKQRGKNQFCFYDSSMR